MGSAGTPGASEWIVNGGTVNANDTVCLTLGICLDAGKFIRVSSSANTVAFAAFVSEIS
jgi:nanoRNase/pAp phosphatase (c-di-AMP/oligoRNAs hydrolase)